MGVCLTNGSKQLIEIDRNSTTVQPMHELAYFKNEYIINFKIAIRYIFLQNPVNQMYALSYRVTLSERQS